MATIMAEIYNPTITAKDFIEGLRYTEVRRKIKKGGVIPFSFEIPMWMITNEDIDFIDILKKEVRRRLDNYRRQVPRRSDKPVRMYLSDMRISVDAESAYCKSRNIVYIGISIEAYFTNAKAQMADCSMTPYEEQNKQ